VYVFTYLYALDVYKTRPDQTKIGAAGTICVIAKVGDVLIRVTTGAGEGSNCR